MGRIPDETLQQVLAATDIVDLIGRSIKLRRSGSNFVGLCPFHHEKTPSFNVRPSTNSYHCFGCGAGGNAFRFLMEHDGLTFMEAVKRLADSAGIRLEEEVWDANAEQAAKMRALMLRAHKELAEWYHQLLMKHSLAQPARDYLTGRGINTAIAKNWQIGYAPAAGALLRQWAARHKFGQQVLLEGGILGQGEQGDCYPRFRHRLMFPIRNENGEVIGFSGRLLDADAKTAKYLNTAETPLFNKSKILFGFDKARRAIAKAGHAIVCEGQIDTIMVHEAGFDNAVAGQGTAFTEWHARLLKRHADEVILCYDSDNAGFKAAERAFQVLAPAGLIVKVAALPTGEDPDTLIRKDGAEAFRAVIAAAKEFVDYQLEAVGSRRNMDSMAERVKFADEMAANIRLLESPVARDSAARHVALRLGIPEGTMQKLLRSGRGTAPKVGANGASNARPVPALLSSQLLIANQLCQMALHDARILAMLREQDLSAAIREVSGTELLSLLWHSHFDPVDPAALNAFFATLEKDQEAAFTQLLHLQPLKISAEEVDRLFVALEVERLKAGLQRLGTQLKNPNLPVDEIAKLQIEHAEMSRRYVAAQKALKADLG